MRTPSTSIALISLGLFGLAILSWLEIMPHGRFGDEHENFVAGWFITEGLIPYRDFFFHHAPLPFFIAAWWEKLGMGWLSIRYIVFIWWLIVGIISWSLVKRTAKLAVATTWYLMALSAGLFHLHYFLAESLAVPVILGLGLLVVDVGQRGGSFSLKAALFAIVSSWLAVWSTIVAALPLAIIAFSLLILWRRDIFAIFQNNFSSAPIQKTRHSVITAFGLLVLIHSAVFAYFALHSALPDMWWAIVTYNTDYYYPLRLAENAHASNYVLSVIQSFFVAAAVNIQSFFGANIIALQSIVGLLKAGLFSTTEHGSYWQVVWETWIATVANREVTVTLLAFLTLTLLLRRGSFGLMLFFLLIWMFSRGRDNEVFKLSFAYLTILSLASWTFWKEFFTLRLRLRHPITNLFVATTIAILLIAWGSSQLAVRRAYLSRDEPFFPDQYAHIQSSFTAQHATTLSQKGDASTAQTALILSGNPDLYYALQLFPAHKYYYYHWWFHDVPSIRAELTEFVYTNRAHPVLLGSEIDGSDFKFAAEIEQQVRDTYMYQGGGVYTPPTNMIE